MILSEGGNVFKTEPEKELIAQRIATPDVDPTIKWLEKVILSMLRNGLLFWRKELSARMFALDI